MKMQAAISAIEYHLPEILLTNEQLAMDYPDWTAQKIEDKLGVSQRHIAANHETAADLGYIAATKLFASEKCRPSDIDYLLFCTQSPDYFLPTTACILQDRLGLPVTTGALDFNLGCSGFVYGLGLAQGLIETGQAKKVLLITAETYSKFIHPGDKSVRTLFGDGAAATLVQAVPSMPEAGSSWIGPIAYGTDGRGAPNLIVPTGGMRRREANESVQVPDENGNLRTEANLYMNGAEIFAFTLQVVPEMVNSLLQQANLKLDDVDLFVFHQANKYMLEHLRKKLRIASDRFMVSMQHCGNTVSSTIPIALKNAEQAGLLFPQQRIMVLGFGVGYSWAGALLRWLGDTSIDALIHE